MTNIQLQFRTHTRDDMIQLGDAVGILVKSPRLNQRPWVITLWGGENSGKSLLALAIDRAFRPQVYKNGIDRTCDANGLRNNFVVFKNFYSIPVYNPNDLDKELDAFISRQPNSGVYIASNSKGFFSTLTDIDISVKTLKGLKRQITCRMKDSNIAETLTSLPFFFKK